MAHRNAKDAMREALGNTRPKVKDAIKLLTDSGIPAEQYVMIATTGAGGRVVEEPYLTPEDFATFLQFLKDKRAAEEARRSAAPAPVVRSSGPAFDVEAHERWKSGIEEMMLDNIDQVDSMRKAVETMVSVYRQLRSDVDQSKTPMPEVPILQPRYRWRILIAGQLSIEALRNNFRDVKFYQVNGERGERLSQMTTPPRVDLVLLMTSALGHETDRHMRKRYDHSIIHPIRGSTSSAESFIAAWLMDKRAAVQAAETNHTN